MRALALDTTTAAGSVAIVEDDRVLVERIGEATRSHAERLPGDLLQALDSGGLAIGDIDLFAIAAGPGTFTGLRIGIATIQGLAFVCGKPVVPVSALTALAVAASGDLPAGQIVGAWMDAHRGDVFSAVFRTADRPPFDRERLEALEDAAVGDPVAVLARWKKAGHLPAVLAGDGAIAFATAVPPQVSTRGQLPLAGVIGQMALAAARAGDTVDPAGIQPIYIRRPDAEIARDKSSNPEILKS
jgi:tRNA threonylcarbamoyladenosine biosynthesis protein TsaB